MMVITPAWVEAVATSIGAVSIFVVYWQLRQSAAQHREECARARREQALRLIWEWTINGRRNTGIAVKLVDELGKPECERIFNQESLSVPIAHGRLLRAALQDLDGASRLEAQDDVIVLGYFEASYLRGAVTRYLNLLESVFLAWQHEVGDRSIIEQEFRYLIMPKGNAARMQLHNYLEVAGGESNYPAIFAFWRTIEREARNGK